MKLLFFNFLHSSVTSFLSLRPEYPNLEIPQPVFFPAHKRRSFTPI